MRSFIIIHEIKTVRNSH